MVSTEIGASVPQVAIRWLLQKRVVTSVVIGAKSVAQLEDNLKSAKIFIPEQHMTLLDSLSAVNPPYPYEMVNRLQGGRKRDLYIGQKVIV